MVRKFTVEKGSFCYILLESTLGTNNFTEQLDQVLRQYTMECTKYGLSDDTTVYIKFYLSDITNQIQLVKSYLNNRKIYCILLGMPPASGAKIAIESYHLVGSVKKEVEHDKVIIQHGKYESMWFDALPSKVVEHSDSSLQTEDILNTVASCISPHCVSETIQRTWFYIRDIDNNYPGFANRRKQWFEQNGMIKDTHYIASTGIQGITALPSHLVYLIVYSERNLQQGQINYLASEDYLSPTHKYNVTFERGVRLDYGEIQQYYISGTASIDRNGEILYYGDLVKQAERIKVNMEALLNSGGATVDDLQMLIVYIRDSSNYYISKETVERLFPMTPYLILNASVCRTGWLIEIEGIAVKNKQSLEYSNYF